MKLQQYRFKFLTISKRIAIGLLVVGFLVTGSNILDFTKAKNIEIMSDPEFHSLVGDFNYDRAPLRSLKAFAKKSLDVSPQEIEASETATREILERINQCLDCQNRIVFFDVTKNEGLTDTGLAALRESYELSPYGETELMKWRLTLSSQFWNELDDDLRKSALSQITALAQFQSGRIWLRNVETDVADIKTRISRLKTL